MTPRQSQGDDGRPSSSEGKSTDASNEPERKERRGPDDDLCKHGSGNRMTPVNWLKASCRQGAGLFLNSFGSSLAAT